MAFAFEDLPTPSKAHERAKQALLRSHAVAAKYADVSEQRLARVLRSAVEDLSRRLADRVRLGRGDTFTSQQMRVALAQLSHVTASLVVPGMRAAIVETSGEAARAAASATIGYLALADRAYRGIAQPLALDEARMLDRAAQGANASVLRRLAVDPEHRARPGILARYGVETIGHFEEELQKAVVAKKPWGEIREDLVSRSPFLQGAPAHWAERIVRTETMGAHGRSQLESAKEADEQLGDVVKVLSSTFDDRTGSDSIADHGMVRRVGEQFASWYGAYDAPPDRPNDRAMLVTHRLSWGPPPAHLRERPWSEVVARWKREGHKGSPPPRNLMSTLSPRAFDKVEKKTSVDRAREVGLENASFLREGMRDSSTHRGAYEGASTKEVRLIARGELESRNERRLLPPLEVLVDEGEVHLTDGRHRLAAAIEAGAEEVHAIVSSYDARGRKVGTRAVLPVSRPRR